MFYMSLKYSFFFLDSLVFQVNQQNIHTTLTILNVIPVDRGRKLNVHKIFRRRPGPLLNVLCAFNLHHVSTGILVLKLKKISFGSR